MNDYKNYSVRAAESLSEAISFQTISNSDAPTSGKGEWVRMREFLKTRYPLAHRVLDREIISGFTILYRWRGMNPDLEPILFCGHLDVVPAVGNWSHGPFSGDIEDGYVWGRGAIDCKHIVISLLEAVEQLLATDFVPPRDIYFAFGHDEEIGGNDGASNLAKVFLQQGIRFAMVLDEGCAITSPEGLPISTPVAHIAATEKGQYNLQLTARGTQGHSSTPPKNSAIALLSEAACRIEWGQCPPRLTPVVEHMLKLLADRLPFEWKFLINHNKLFRKKLLKELAQNPTTNALIRTTIVPTMVHSGNAYNIIPDTAEMIFNVRLLHGDDIEKVVTYLQDLTKDLNIEIETLKGRIPSELSDLSGAALDAISKSIYQIFGDIPVVTTLMSGGTDCRKYEKFSKSVYRFCPFELPAEELHRMHGVDERVSIESLGKAVAFYMDLFKRW